MPFNSLPLACPLDGLLLYAGARQLRCPAGHCYDIARQGYVNLLPVQFKASKEPGDSKDMIDARRRVMQQNYFNELAEKFCSYLVQLCDTPVAGSCILDAGCGEGFFTDKMNAHVCNKAGTSGTSLPRAILGIDVSKLAIIAAAKQYRALNFAVASNVHPPIINGNASIITNLFGFATWPAWSSLQRPGQYVVTVDAGPHHLLEMREIIYPEVRIHAAPEHAEAAKSGYSLADTQTVRYEVILKNAADRLDFLNMTPHGRKINAHFRQVYEESALSSLTLDAVIRSYRKQ